VLILAGTGAASGTFALFMLAVSSLNYPGGDAMHQLASMIRNNATIGAGPVHVHADVLSCMTGVTLFGQNPSGYPVSLAVPDIAAGGARAGVTWSLPPPPAGLMFVDKTEDKELLAVPDFWERFDYVLAEDPETVVGGDWDVLGVVEGYAGLEMTRSPTEAPGGEESGEVPHSNGAVTVSNGTWKTEDDSRGPPVLGKGAMVARLKGWVRTRTGWSVGPRMVPKVYILKQWREKGQARAE
jgi:alpha-1,6-mannosyltransferase